MDRTFVTFEADFPVDLDDEGQIANPQGLSIARFLRESLKFESIEVGEPDNNDDFAWDLRCVIGRAVVSVMIGRAEPWLINVYLCPWILNPSRGVSGANAIMVICSYIDRLMKAEPRFREIRWFTKEEFDSFDSLDSIGGASSP